jgi:hypothetical protein
MPKRYALVVLTAAALLAATSLPAASGDKSLVLAFSFDEGNGATAEDGSMYGFKGKVKASWTTGKYGKALKFNGQDDIVTVADDPKLRFADTNACTLMAWINVEGQGSSVWPRVMAREQATGSNGGFHMPLDWAAGVKVRIVIDGSTGYTSPDPLTLGKWHHAAVTCDGKVSRIFLDGRQIFQGPQEKPFPDAAAPLGIGGSTAGARPFQGIIDEVRIWNRALSEAEIKEQMGLSTPQFLPVDPRARLATTWGGLKAE